jgi:hypothetical protein
MTRCPLPIVLCLTLSAGCTDLGGSTTTPTVPADPFHNAALNTTSSKSLACPPATAEAATRVTTLGQKIVKANPQLGLHPLFITVGAPHHEIFHQGTTSITITEGLVKQCNTDGQLAAALCSELGKMSAERQATALAQAHRPPRFEAMDVHVGNDYGGSFGPADRSDLAERAKLERDFGPSDASQAPDPHVLAQAYLVRAGYPAADLEVIEPLLHSAEGNNRLEKQVNGAKP